jgi:hypothetical protein
LQSGSVNRPIQIKIEMAGLYAIKLRSIKFHEDLSSRSRIVSRGQTEGTGAVQGSERNIQQRLANLWMHAALYCFGPCSNSS